MLLASKDPGGMNDFFIHKFPFYNKFRDSKMILVILQIVLPMIAMLFVNELIKNRLSYAGDLLKKRFYVSCGVILGFFLLLYVSPSLSGDFKNDKSDKVRYGQLNQFNDGEFERSYINNPEKFKSFKSEVIAAREFIFKKDVGRALIFSLLILGLVYFIILKKPSVWIISGALLLLVSTDNIGVSLRYLNSDEDLDDRRGESQYIAALTAQNYLEESEELPPLNKYENSKLALLPPNIPKPSDYSILEGEKLNISNFDEKVGQYKKKMSSYYMFEDIKSEKTKNILAEFATLNLNSDYRVLWLGDPPIITPFNETQTSYYHKSIGGYHGAKLKRFQELVDFYISREYGLLFQYHSQMGPQIFRYTPILNMLNTKYVITNPDEGALFNPMSQGNAWYVSNIKSVKTADEEIQALGDSSIDLRTTAVIHKEFKNIKVPENIDSAKISLTKYGLNHLVYDAYSEFAGPVVFSEIYYPEGWNCYIDGKKVDDFRANYILRGVMVPAGKHKIEWKFEPKSMETGSLISGIGSALLILSCLAIFFIEIKNIKTADE